MFYRMEQLGNAGEKQEIEQGMPQLLALYRSYKNKLSEYVRTSEENLVEVSAETIRHTLMRLHDAVDTFDLDAADQAMKELDTYALPEAMQPMAEQLRVYVADVAMEEIMHLTEEMCKQC